MRLTNRIVLLSIGAVCGAAMAIAQVAPTTVFQLDGNSGTTSQNCAYGPCDYFNLLNGTGSATATVTANQTPPTSAGNWSLRTYVPGVFNTLNFTGGGSKDPSPISQWAYTSTSTPPKTTLDAAYAAAYQANGDFVLIFGADRSSASGDTNIGLWFFQQPVAPNGSGGFTGAHTNGDIFVISAFTTGGGTSTISVYAWDQPGLPGILPGGPAGGCSAGVKNPTPGQCADTNLLLIAAPTNVCGSSIYCAITNTQTVTASWATTANGYTVPQVSGGGQLVSPLFFEGGMDISATLSSIGITSLPCFSSFLIETRSSQSTSAVLKDFLAGSFQICGLSVTKSCGIPLATTDGTAINYPVSGTVTNTGIGTLYNVTVFDTPTSPAGATRTLTVSPSTLAPGASGAWSDTSTTAGASASDSAMAQGGATSSIVPNGSAGVPGVVTSSNTATATCTSSFDTPLSVTKTCGIPAGTNNVPPAVPGVTLTGGTSVGILVNYSGTVCNNGVSAVTGVVLTDTPNQGPAGTINIGSLGPAGSSTQCASYSGSYVPTNLDGIVSGGTGPGRYTWGDLITITGAKATIGSLCKIGDPAPCPQYTSAPTGTVGTYGFGTANCPLCQGSGECTTP
jgi:hypothetical protein